MKIAKRTEPFEGAICRITKADKDYPDFLKEGVLFIYEEATPEDLEFEVIGKLGKTHEIKDGRLVEIQRESAIKSDVAECDIFEGSYKMNILVKKIAIGENSVKLACDIFNPDGSFEWHTNIDADEFLGDKYKRIGSLHYSHEIKAG